VQELFGLVGLQDELQTRLKQVIARSDTLSEASLVSGQVPNVVQCSLTTWKYPAY
jgi:hypothetical protein